MSKSSVDRSTEAVARGLMVLPDEVDTMAVLRDAKDQQELKFAQRRLASMQRFAEKQEIPKKVLTGAPKFISTEARLQAAWVAEKKAERDTGKTAGKYCASGPSAAAEDAVDLHVECRRCGLAFSWAVLAAGDGCCAECLHAPAGSGQARTSAQPAQLARPPVCEGDLAPAEDLLVQCRGCDTTELWSQLEAADGLCASCASAENTTAGAASEQKAVSASVEAGSEASHVAHFEAALHQGGRWNRSQRLRDNVAPVAVEAPCG